MESRNWSNSKRKVKWEILTLWQCCPDQQAYSQAGSILQTFSLALESSVKKVDHMHKFLYAKTYKLSAKKKRIELSEVSRACTVWTTITKSCCGYCVSTLTKQKWVKIFSKGWYPILSSSVWGCVTMNNPGLIFDLALSFVPSLLISLWVLV